MNIYSYLLRNFNNMRGIILLFLFVFYVHGVCQTKDYQQSLVAAELIVKDLFSEAERDGLDRLKFKAAFTANFVNRLFAEDRNFIDKELRLLLISEFVGPHLSFIESLFTKDFGSKDFVGVDSFLKALLKSIEKKASEVILNETVDRFNGIALTKNNDWLAVLKQKIYQKSKDLDIDKRTQQLLTNRILVRIFTRLQQQDKMENAFYRGLRDAYFTNFDPYMRLTPLQKTRSHGVRLRETYLGTLVSHSVNTNENQLLKGDIITAIYNEQGQLTSTRFLYESYYGLNQLKSYLESHQPYYVDVLREGKTKVIFVTSNSKNLVKKTSLGGEPSENEKQWEKIYDVLSFKNKLITNESVKFNIDQLQFSLKYTQKNYKGIIIDLRGCPGGDVHAALLFLSYFTNERVLLTAIDIRNGDQSLFSRRTDIMATYAKTATIILVDKNTASSAEIIAGTLAPQSNVKLVGEKTFGKGIMQESYNLERVEKGNDLKVGFEEFLSVLYFTTRKLYLGKNRLDYHGKGLVPEINVPESKVRQWNGSADIFHYSKNLNLCKTLLN